MKFEFDKRYFKICFHVVTTFIVIYIFKYLIDSGVVLITNMDVASNKISGFFSILFDVFFPVIIAFVMAYLLDPICERIQKKYESKRGVKLKNGKYRTRFVGTLVIYLVFFTIVGFLLYSIFGQLSFSSKESFLTAFNDTITGAINSINHFYDQITVWLTQNGLIGYFENVLNAIFDFATGIVNSVLNGILRIGTGLFSFFLSLVFGFYILKDKEEFIYKAKYIFATFLPDRAMNGISRFLNEVNDVFAGYIRGQITDALIVGTLLSIMLSILNVPLALLIGIVSGFSNLIPYVGAFVAFVLAMVASMFADPAIPTAIAAAVGILIVQQIDSIYIVPKVVGKNVELSPFVVLLALTLAGSIFGIFGMIFAVPFTAILKNIITRFIDRQRKSQGIKNALTPKKQEEENKNHSGLLWCTKKS